jgi:hypothetical protein
MFVIVNLEILSCLLGDDLNLKTHNPVYAFGSIRRFDLGPQ